MLQGINNSKYQKCWDIIERRNFLPEEQQENSSQDKPIPIGEGQTTSQPSLIINKIMMLIENIEPSILLSKKIRALDVGSGSGIVTAFLACLLKKTDHVIGVEIFNSLVEQSKRNIDKIDPIARSNFANISIENKDIYDIFKTPSKMGKFDIIYVGAEPKTPTDIDLFKKNIPKLLTKDGIALGPINGSIQLYSNKKRWVATRLLTRFVPLFQKKDLEARNISSKITSVSTNPSIGATVGGSKGLTEREQKQLELIKRENASRWSINCKDTDKICKSIAITSRSANLYKNHLFPDLKNFTKIDKKVKDKCIIDLGSGINTISKTSFIARMSRKNLGIDKVGIDISPLTTKKNKSLKHYARFVRGNAKTLKLKRLKLDKKCSNKKIVLINNLLYLWIDKPKELLEFYKNIISWLDKGSEIRIFPVYFGRYDMYNSELKKYIDSKCSVKTYTPKYTDDNYSQWHLKKTKKVYINKSIHNEESDINTELGAKTLVLTIK